MTTLRRRPLPLAAALTVVAALAVLAVACVPPTSGGGGGPTTNWSVDPSATGVGISADPLFTHLAWAPTATPTTPVRDRLVVLLHGTGSNPQAHTVLGQELRADGYHVVALRAPAPVATFDGCPDEEAATFPDCHRAFRGETLFGAGVPDRAGLAVDHPDLSVTAANSVMNRLLRLLEHLRTIAPTAGWDRFQARTGAVCDVVDPVTGVCDLRWDRVVAMGHSQGAGVALYLGKVVGLDRVAMLSGSYDAFDLGGGSYQVATWITEGGSATPASRVGELLHTGDPGIGVFRAVADALGLAGPEVSVTASAPPYGGSRRLVTSLTPACPFDSSPRHNSTATDLCAPAGAYTAARRYLAGS